MKPPAIWRLLSALALAVLAGCIVLLVLFVAATPLLVAVIAPTVMVLLYGTWLVFSGTRKRLRYGWILVVACCIVFAAEMVMLFVRGEQKGSLLGAVLLGMLYLYLVRMLRRHYWDQERKLAGVNRVAGFLHPVLIINPKAGDGRAIKAGVDTIARKRGIEVVITQKQDNIEALARHAAKQGADVIGVSGGDGTIGAVAKVALEHDLPLVVLPGGTRCHFARDLGLDPERIVDALESFWGVPRTVDVGMIDERVFLNNASFGVYADIARHVEYREHKVATTRKVLQQALGRSQRPYSLKFTDDRGVRHTRAAQVFVGVNPYQTLSLFELGHREQLDSGLLHVVVIATLDDATIRQLMGALTFGLHTGGGLSDHVLQWTAPQFTLDTNTRSIVAGVDGETERYQVPVRIRIVPGRLTVMVPAEGARSRPRSPFSPTVLRRLWWAVWGR